MVKVANDRTGDGGNLPSARSQAGDSGIRLGTVAALPAAAGAGEATVHVSAARADSFVTRTCSLADAVQDPEGRHHQLVLARAADLEAELASRSGLLAAFAAAGIGALAVAGAGAGLATTVVGASEEVDLPLLLLPEGHLERLNTEVLSALLDHQTAILQRLEAAHQALVQIVLGGGSLVDVCQQLVGFLDGAVMVTTTDGRVLASAGAQDELDWATSLGCFDRTGRFMTENEPIGIRAPGPVGPRAAVRIVAGSLDHGVLAAFSRERMLTVEDVQLLERAATVAALAITKEQAVSAVESKYRAEFLRDALAGRAGSAAEAIAHARSLGWDIERPMVVVVAQTDEDDEQSIRDAEEVRFLQQRFAKAWTHAVSVRDPASPVMGFSREVVAVLGVADPDDMDRVMRSVGTLVRIVRGDGGGGRRSFSAGVSRPITAIGALPRAYEEALSAVTVGRQMRGDGALSHVDELGIYRLLALIPDSAQLRRFVDAALGELATDRSPENAGLRQTLRILIDTNMNVAETARLLFFHYNTLRYRIAKLEKMLGPFTDDPELRLTLALALKVHQMRGIGI